MSVIERVVGFPVRIGREQHSGWLPAGAAMPLPTPVRDLLLDIEIQYEDSGYLLCFISSDGSVYGDTWHESLEDAGQAAAECFGVQRDQWRPG